MSMKYVHTRRLDPGCVSVPTSFGLQIFRTVAEHQVMQVGKGSDHCHVFIYPPEIQDRKGMEEFTPTWCL